MKLGKYGLLLYCLCFWLPSVLAQDSGIIFDKISSKEGLPSNQVNFITQDTQGYLWFGFKQNLARYDGYHFILFPQKEVLFGLHADNQGRIWFANINGLYAIDGKTLKTTQYITSNLSDAIPENDHHENIFVDTRGRVWMNDFNNIKYYTPNTRKLSSLHIVSKTNLSIFVTKYAEDTQGNIWIGNAWGLQVFDNQQQKLKKISTTLRITDLCFNTPQSLLLTTEDGGIWEYYINTNTFRKIGLFPAGNDSPKMIRKSHKKNLFWIGSERAIFLFSSQNGSFQSFKNLSEEGYSYSTLFQDEQNKIFWIASSSGLLKYNHHDAELFQDIQLPKNLVSFPVKVSCFAQENAELFWLGLSHSGLLRWNRNKNTFESFKLPKEERVIQILRLPDGTFLACTPARIYQFIPKNQQWHLFLESPYTLQKIGIDTNNRLWCLYENGPIQVFSYPHRYPITPWKKLPHANFFFENIFHDFLQTSDGKIWLAAWFPKGFGICYFDTFKNEFVLAENNNRHLDFVSDYYLSVAQIDSNTVVFSGYGGFNCLNTRTGNISRIGSSIKLNLRGGNCHSLGIDFQNNIWLATTDGLCCVNPNNHVSYFTETDGLSDNNVVNGFLLTPNNEIWAGFINRFNILNINKLQTKKVFSELRISNIQIVGDTSSVDLSRPLVFGPVQNNLSFQVSPLNFRPISQNHIRFKLLGIQSGWIDNGTVENITFSNLTPKKYQLAIQLGDGMGNWSEQSLIVPFEIIPYFYQTWWFQLILAGIVGIIMYGVYLYRIQQIKAIYLVRNRISADLHDEVGATISGISIISNILKQRLDDSPENKSFVERIAEDARKISEAIDDIVWSIKPQNDSIDNILSRMTRYASELMEAKNINYQVIMPTDISDKTIPMEKRHDVYLIFKESLNNIAKHSQCTEAKIVVNIGKKSLNMIIEDNGVGFDISQKTNRNGLINLKERTEKLRGSLLIESTKGIGTKITIDIPI